MRPLRRSGPFTALRTALCASLAATLAAAGAVGPAPVPALAAGDPPTAEALLYGRRSD